MYGNEDRIWLRPTTLTQLIDIFQASPDVKLVGGSSEIQIEVKVSLPPSSQRNPAQYHELVVKIPKIPDMHLYIRYS